MSWLYSIIFAGLLFSSDSKLHISDSRNLTNVETANIALLDETERFEQTYPLNANGRVSISNVNGSIAVETWDRNEVKFSYVKTADTKENLDDVQVVINARPDYFRVETEFEAVNYRGSKSYKRLDVEYRLTVPRGAVLNEIETVNGSVSVMNAENSTKASAVNGEVRATNLRGTANLSTVNGTVVADFDQLQTGSRISLNTVNGTVNLTIPSDANATIKADTVNGKITNGFGLPVRKGEYVGSDLYGKVGSGDVQIRLNSVNGGLSVNRKNDGRNVNPATNLLNMKNDGNDEDWDEDEDNDSGDTSRVKPPRAPRAPRPPRSPIIDDEAINKSVQESLREASKEMEKIKPELEKIYSEEMQKELREASKIDSAQMREQMKLAQEKYQEALVKLGELNWANGSPRIEKKSQTFSVKGTPRISVEANNCAVFVRGWDKQEVSYSITRISRGVQSPAQTDSTVSVRNTDSTVDIKVSSEMKSPDGIIFDDAGRSRIEIFVPKKSNLKIKTGGEIRLEGVSGEIDLQGVDESINVRDADGKLSVGTVDGRIRVIGFRGAFDGKTSDGTMNLEGDFQTFNALASDGTIVLTLPETANAVLEANTEIENEGVNLIRENNRAKIWRVGNGGTVYRMSVNDGKVIVRSADNMTVY